MAVLRMSAEEVARDFAAVLDRVGQGSEVVVEQDHRAVAIIRASPPPGRMISEVIAALDSRQSTAEMDESFAQDIAAGIAERSEPWYPAVWE
jgi:antitoxin (DNA-binding transcriptional repressor) of toxin-antitoxin stability system